MRSPEYQFLDFLPGAVQPYVLAGMIIAAALTLGLILLAVTIRNEDAETSLAAHAPGPIARRVRHMLSLHVYTGDAFSYGSPDGRRAEAADTPPATSPDPSRSRSVMLTSVTPDERGQRAFRAWLTWDEHDRWLPEPSHQPDPDYYGTRQRPDVGHYHGPAA